MLNNTGMGTFIRTIYHEHPFGLMGNHLPILG